jgi:hypothetical protein
MNANGASGGSIRQLDPTTLATVRADVAARIKSAAASAAVIAPLRPLAPSEPAPAKPVKPGVERWPVKTGTDEDVDRVGKNDFAGAGSDGIVETTVEELINLPRPPDMSDIHSIPNDFQDRRAEPVEFVIWRVKADITVIKKEADGDLHIVLQGDSGRTMVAEAPTPDAPFVEDSSPWLDAMKEARKRISEQFGPSFAGVEFRPLDNKFVMPASPILPLASAAGAGGPAAPRGLLTVPPGTVEAFESLPPFEAKVPQTPATITGVGFFDRVHGQTGVALKNGIELHPILAIEFN